MALDLGKARRMETDAAIAGVRRVRNEEVLCCIVLCRVVSCCVVLCRAVSCRPHDRARKLKRIQR